MNCRSEVLEVTVEARQVEEAMLALLHTILLHRSTGKFHYKKEGTYSIGTVGTLDIDCDFIDFTFVRVSSEELDRVIRKGCLNSRGLWLLGCCSTSGLFILLTDELQGSGLLDSSAIAPATGAVWVDLNMAACGERRSEFWGVMGGEGDR
ncbi:hypothetical protein INR49_026226, partial [Caranx melampygus]